MEVHKARGMGLPGPYITSDMGVRGPHIAGGPISLLHQYRKFIYLSCMVIFLHIIIAHYLRQCMARGGWTRLRARKKGCVSQCKFPIVTKVHENMQIRGSSFVCLLTSLKDNDTARYPVCPLYWMVISTFATFLLVLDELQHSATDSTFYFNPFFQISTKNAADPIANERTSQDEYCGWGISASINVQRTKKRIKINSIDYPIALN